MSQDYKLVIQPQVSIVVPIFNTEKYLERCIQSLINQMVPEVEIILVNDGSTDSSGTICDLYAKKDSRIQVIHKKNEGVTIARKTGVEYASGEWICFVDSDDELLENAIKTLFTYARDDIDMVIGMAKYTGHWKKWPFKYCYEEKKSLQYTKAMLKERIHASPWARLIRKTLFDFFIWDMPYLKSGQDYIMNIRLGQKVRKIILLPDIVYHYIWQPNSTSAKKVYDKNYRCFFNSILYQSILPEYKSLLKTLFIQRQKYTFKIMLKNVILNVKFAFKTTLQKIGGNNEYFY